MARKLGSNGSVRIPKDPIKREQWLKHEASKLLAKQESTGVGVGYLVISGENMPDHQPLTEKGSDAFESIIDRLRSLFKIPPPRLPLPGLQSTVLV